MKLYYVSFVQFINNLNNTYFTYHSYYYNNRMSPYYSSSPIEDILPGANNYIELSLEDNNTNYFEQYLGKDNIFYFIAN